MSRRPTFPKRFRGGVWQIRVPVRGESPRWVKLRRGVSEEGAEEVRVAWRERYERGERIVGDEAARGQLVRSLLDPQERPINWLLVTRYELSNPDYLPAALCPVEGCSTCGAAFVAVESLGVREQPAFAEEVQIMHGRSLYVRAPALLRVEAVRFICSEGHTHEHEASPWTLLGDTALPIAVGVLATAYLATHFKKGSS